MSDSEFNLQELHEKITFLFERHKENLNRREHPNVNYLLYNLNAESDMLLYKVKYEIDNFLKDNGKDDDGASQSGDSSAINRKKAECLIKLQTVTSMLTGHVVEHYKKKMEERSGPKR
ncbi:hypothetical protein MTP99_015407 [Tenebrio molitor]|jgi:hypothetical protein|nr:hypothetical protein MTP99_015407 [Tenebrio molitor]CAH1374036.1 unnamed protein product [Tenebrio molitor]